jgi:hypothetical protein
MSYLKHVLLAMAIVVTLVTVSSVSAAQSSGLVLNFDENNVWADASGVARADYTICNVSDSPITFGQSFNGDVIPQAPVTLDPGVCVSPAIGGPLDTLGKHWTLEAFDPVTHEVLASDRVVVHPFKEE